MAPDRTFTPSSASSLARRERERRRRLMRNAPKFYGVRHGDSPGVFRTWKEVQQQLKAHKGVKYKSFFTHEDALDYANGGTGEARSDSWFGVHGAPGAGVYKHFDEVVNEVTGYPRAKFLLCNTYEEARTFSISGDTSGANEDMSHGEETPTSTAQPERATKRRRVEEATPDVKREPKTPGTPRLLLDLMDGAFEEEVEADSEPDNTPEDPSQLGTQLESPDESRDTDKRALRSRDRSSRSNQADAHVDIAALQRENEQLRAEIQLLREQQDISNNESTKLPYAFTLCIARPKLDQPGPFAAGPYPEENMQVVDVFDSLKAATDAAWETFKQCCPDRERFTTVESQGLIDRTDFAPSVCHKRVTKDGELRLYWKDSKARAGFIMVQKKKIHGTGAQSQPDPTTAHKAEVDAFWAEESPRECFLLCEHFKAARTGAQDGGMLGAYRSLALANHEAEKHFLASFEANEQVSIVDIESTDQIKGQGAWKSDRTGRVRYDKIDKKGAAKVWIEKFLVK